MAETTALGTSQVTGVENSNPYGGDNTKSYTDNIKDQYSQMVSDHNEAVSNGVTDAVGALNRLKAANNAASQRNLDSAKQDLRESIATRDGIEQNNGNRQRIGHSQYDINANTYDQQQDSIIAQRKQIAQEATREIADLRAQGEYEKANAALQAAQAKFKQLYTDAMRNGKNLRSNYEYETSLQREDEKIIRTQEQNEIAWKRTLGESFLKKGILPPDDLLNAMGLDSETAQAYANAILYGGYGGGGGGGGRSSSGRSSGGGGGNPITSEYADPDDGISYWGTNSSYDSRVASQVTRLARSGNLEGAMNWLGANQDKFSESNGYNLANNAIKRANQAAAEKRKLQTKPQQQSTVSKIINRAKTTTTKTTTKATGKTDRVR